MDGQEPEQGEAFGFETGKKDEKYNTRYLVANMEKDKRNARLMVGGVIVGVAVLCWGIFKLAATTPHPLNAKKEEEAAAAAAAPAAAPSAAPAGAAAPAPAAPAAAAAPAPK